MAAARSAQQTQVGSTPTPPAANTPTVPNATKGGGPAISAPSAMAPNAVTSVPGEAITAQDRAAVADEYARTRDPFDAAVTLLERKRNDKIAADGKVDKATRGLQGAKGAAAHTAWTVRLQRAADAQTLAEQGVVRATTLATKKAEDHKATLAQADAVAKAQEAREQKRVSNVNEFRTKLGAYGIKPTSDDMKRMEPILGNPNNEISDVDALIENLFPGAKQAHATKAKIAESETMAAAGWKLNPVTQQMERVARADAKESKEDTLRKERDALAAEKYDKAQADTATAKADTAFYRKKEDLRKQRADAERAINDLGDQNTKDEWKKGGAKHSAYWGAVAKIKAITDELDGMGDAPPSERAKPDDAKAKPASVADQVKAIEDDTSLTPEQRIEKLKALRAR